MERSFRKSDHEITEINDEIKLNYDPKLQIISLEEIISERFKDGRV